MKILAVLVVTVLALLIEPCEARQRIEGIERTAVGKVKRSPQARAELSARIPVQLRVNHAAAVAASSSIT